MASSLSKCFAPRTDRSPLANRRSPFSEGGLWLDKNPQSLSLPPLTCKSTHDEHSDPFTSRSSKGTAICSFVIAATTVVGLSFCSLDCFAIAAELKVNDSAILSVANAQTNPNSKPVSDEGPRFTLIYNPSSSSKTDLDLSFGMAIPIPQEKVWVDVQNGFLAPLPHIHEHGLVTRSPQPRKTVLPSEGATLQCPQWTPIELEMVLPDFHGRPKPFPHQGHHWLASFVMRGVQGEAFLQISDSDNEIQLKEIGTTDGKTLKGKTSEKEMEGKLPLLKTLGMEKITCFSM